MNRELELIKCRKILLLLSKAEIEYKKYIFNGQKFTYTKNLKDINKKILIISKDFKIEGNRELKKTFIDLLEHLYEWSLKWDIEKNIQMPSEDEEFIFDGYKKFPREISSLLDKYLKEQLEL